MYVQFNAKLLNKKRRVKETGVLLASEATNAQGWIVEGGDDEAEPGSGLIEHYFSFILRHVILVTYMN